MGRVVVSGFGLSIDGFAAGPDQNIDQPLGANGPSLMEWAFTTRTFQQMHGGSGGATGIDDDFAARGMANKGAWIIGRNMFGPIRGAWPDDAWKGWWGDEPPYHVPVFVLTHHSRAPIEMAGGTTFHFVTDGIAAALARARAAAGPRDIRIGGGPATVRQYVAAGLVDELHLAMAPCVLGAGERPFDGIDLRALGYACTERAPSDQATHVVLTKAA